MIDKCPECGGALQGTLTFYLSDIILDDDHEIISCVNTFSGSELDLDLSAADAIHIYCDKDHTIGAAGDI